MSTTRILIQLRYVALWLESLETPGVKHWYRHNIGILISVNWYIAKYVYWCITSDNTLTFLRTQEYQPWTIPTSHYVQSKLQILKHKFPLCFTNQCLKLQMINDKFQMINDKFQMINDKFQMINDKFQMLLSWSCFNQVKLVIS